MTRTPGGHSINYTRIEFAVQGTDYVATKAEPVGLKRSIRERHEPCNLTCDELGEFLILARLFD